MIKLTKRQTEVLILLAKGLYSKNIADELKISIKTVEKHRQSLIYKLKRQNIAMLTSYAIKHNYIEAY